MAEIWEISAVVALRDLQWVFAPTRRLPEPAINLAGNAESRLGDAALLLGGRFFIFEIKSQASKFNSEWKKKKRADGVVGPKHAYSSVMAMAKSLSEDYQGADAWSEVIASLRCHHFVYWHVGLPLEMHMKLALQPYLAAVLQGSSSQAGLSGLSVKLQQDAPLAGRYDDGVFRRLSAATVSCVYSDCLGIACRNESKTYDWYRLGLEMKEFQEYVGALMKSAPRTDEPLNAVVISTEGWQRPLRTTKDLAQLLQDLSVAVSRPQVSRRAEVGNDEIFDVRDVQRFFGDVVGDEQLKMNEVSPSPVPKVVPGGKPG